jgi:uncharacterized protein
MAGSNFMASDPTKQQVFYIHGASAYSDYQAYLQDLSRFTPRDLPWLPPRKKWTDALRADLGEGYEVFMPKMPNQNNAKYIEWKIWFERHFEYLRDGVILLGWSQGGYFLVKYLIENDTPFQVKALFLCAAPFNPDDFGGEDGGDFAFDTNAVSVLQGRVGKIFILHSKDDPVVPFSHGEQYAEALPHATFMTFEDKNHFLVEEFPELLDQIRELD